MSTEEALKKVRRNMRQASRHGKRNARCSCNTNSINPQ